MPETRLFGPEVIKKSCSTHQSMKFLPLMNVKMPTVVSILTFMSRKNSILGLSKAALLFWFFGDFRCGALLFMVIHVIY